MALNLPGPAHHPSSIASRVGQLPKTSTNVYILKDREYRADLSPKKLGLHTGVYKTKEGKQHLFRAVIEAERRILQGKQPKMYLHEEGLNEFRQSSAELLLGANHPLLQEGRVAIIQSIGGSGALSIGGSFIKMLNPEADIYISDPSWAIYELLFSHTCAKPKYYRYSDFQAKELDFDGMMADLIEAPNGSFIVLQCNLKLSDITNKMLKCLGCAHNPTGVDPTDEQWKAIGELCQSKGHLPFFDLAYQGFGKDTLEDDVYAIRLFAELGLEFLISQTYSKTLSLYGERIGSLSFIGNERSVVDTVQSHFNNLSTVYYSQPPLHGARIVAEVLKCPELHNQWQSELREISTKVKNLRIYLHDRLMHLMPNYDWTPVLNQKGMFTVVGLSQAQMDCLQEKYHVYIAPGGRISLASLPETQVDYFAESLANSLQSSSLNGQSK